MSIMRDFSQRFQDYPPEGVIVSQFYMTEHKYTLIKKSLDFFNNWVKKVDMANLVSLTQIV